jgi:hypothetical protein
MTVKGESIYDQTHKDKVCELLMLGHPLSWIVKQDGMPSRTTVTGWLMKDEQFKKDYEFARNVQYEYMLDEILEISDDASSDTTYFPDGSKKHDFEHINRARLRVDSRKWALSHLLPKKFGAKTQVDVAADVKTTTVLTDEDKLDLAKWMAFELTKAVETK